ncbi:toll/interleukin-1 receptor domain-containing protein [Micromonospora robiginosa]|uniref:TIR domain-containing protein n=1 Tax=Micromonospora robiginosa TaxID=2749844 RepID=A0A7L6B5W8_9ACTN|nr:TIR domain-containing protein [Micromonospora ferruginea]QLQ37338.1 TIR domain-containing protein [Micromonospora ferruginea]
MTLQDTPLDQFEVALSFASEQRSYVHRVATALKRAGVEIFYDLDQTANLLGEDLYQHLDMVYRNADCVVIFVSKEYAEKHWTKHELRSAQARAFTEHHAYILPGRFDDTELPGLRGTEGYVDLSNCSPTKFAEVIAQKLRHLQAKRSNIRPRPPAPRPSPKRRTPWPGMPWRSAALLGFLAVLFGAGAVFEWQVGVLGASDAASATWAVALVVIGALSVGTTAVLWQRNNSIVPRPGRALAVAAAGLLLGALFGLFAEVVVKPATYVETAGNRNGSKLFTDPSGNPVPSGAVIPYLTTVRVECKAPNRTAITGSPYFYRIYSKPWRGAYALAATFANGDPIGSAGPTDVDPKVRDC